MVEGEIEAGKLYTEANLNKIIEIQQREQQQVAIFLAQIYQRQKTLVFCANQDHALAIRDLINQLKSSTDPNYCLRVTTKDGQLGNTWLRTLPDYKNGKANPRNTKIRRWQGTLHPDHVRSTSTSRWHGADCGAAIDGITWRGPVHSRGRSQQLEYPRFRGQI